MSWNTVDSAVKQNVRPLVTLGTVFGAGFGLIWLAVEPVAVFGLDDELDEVGIAGYVAMLLLAAVVSLVVVLVRLILGYREAAISPPGSVEGPSLAELISQDSDGVDGALDRTLEANPTETVDADHPDLTFTDRLLVAGALRYLRRLGLLRVEHGVVRAASGSARTLLAQLADHAAIDLSLGGDWESDTPSDVSRRVALLQATEESRARRGGVLPPVRFATSVIVLVSTSVDGERYVLAHRSSAWGVAYDWFIGGIVEQRDASLEAAARRELWEETGIEPACVATLSHVGTVQDQRVSERLKVLTEYTYEIFRCTVKPGVKLPHPAGEVSVTMSGKTATQQLSWLTAKAMAESPDLRRDAPQLTERMAELLMSEPVSIPQDQLQIVP